MPDFIKKEFRNHPLGTFLVCLTCLSMILGGVAFVYAQGAQAKDIVRDIEDIANDVQRHTMETSIHPRFRDTSDRFVTRIELQRIDNQLKELNEGQVRQEVLSVEILKRLPKEP